MNAEMLLNWAGLAVSSFNTISLFWLGLTVLLNGDRRSPGTWLTGSGLLLGAVFFTSHTAILGRGLANAGLGMDFWWWVSWVPAVVAPLAWYSAMLWYADFRVDRPHPHRPWLALVAGLAAATLTLLLWANPVPTYSHVVWRSLAPSPTLLGAPLLILGYLGYSILCYLLPLDLLRRATASAGPLAASARRGARPWLTAVSALLLLGAGVMAATALWAVRSSPRPSLSQPATVLAVKQFDLAVAGIIALAITLLGRAIVGHAVFTGRPLPRQGFFRQWRSTVILAAGFSIIVAWTLTIQLRPLYSLMLAGAIMILFHALYSWRFSVERKEFMARLRPFIASLDLYDQLVEASPPDDDAPQGLFESLCRDVLGARAAALLPSGALVTLAGPPLSYPRGYPPPSLPATAELAAQFSDPEMHCRAASHLGLAWAVPLWTHRGLGGLLLLDQKRNGNPYTEEEIEIAQAGGERLLDTLAGAELARLALRLLRQRLAQVKLMEGQGRRILHDEVLPQLHAAILYLGEPNSPNAQQAVEALTEAHRQISNLVREVASAAPQRLAGEGLVRALLSLMEGECAAEFDTVRWDIEPDAAAEVTRLPLFVQEVVFFAAQELVRNAARYARGDEPGRPLQLTVRLQRSPRLRLVVEDDGVGLRPTEEIERESLAGSGSGLRFHSTMLAAVGAELEVVAQPERGTQGIIALPAGATQLGGYDA
ncbi:MAG: hypothetical protein JXA37_10805 [Chloroflexia bacterium]|nr:hypothetical protein [Chloroflexia bacterium]